MKKLLFFLICFCSTVEAEELSRNKVNVTKVLKSSDDQKHNQLGYTTELVVYEANAYFTPTISFTTPDKFNLSISSQNSTDNIFISASQFLKITNQFALILGGQLGYDFSADTQKFQSIEYLDLRIRPVNWLIFHVGPFYVNRAVSSTYDYVGLQTGVEFNFKKMKLNFDYFGGHSMISGATATLTNKWSSYFNSYIGIGVPETNSNNEFYGIIGLNFNMDI